MWFLVLFMFAVGFVSGWIYCEEQRRKKSSNVPLTFECPACNFKLYSNTSSDAVEIANAHMKANHFKEV